MFQHTEQEYQELKARYNDAIDKNAALRGEVARLREAVEWACGVLERSHDNPYMQPDIVAAELRRRAGRE